MKKLFILPISAAVLLSSCGTYAGSGAMTGGSLGSVLGSAIGGIAGGARGSDIGTIVGMAGGAIVGASAGAKADQRTQDEVHDCYEKVRQRKARMQRSRVGRDDYSQTGTTTPCPAGVTAADLMRRTPATTASTTSRAVTIQAITVRHSPRQRLRRSRVWRIWPEVTAIRLTSRS